MILVWKIQISTKRLSHPSTGSFPLWLTSGGYPTKKDLDYKISQGCLAAASIILFIKAFPLIYDFVFLSLNYYQLTSIKPGLIANHEFVAV